MPVRLLKWLQSVLALKVRAVRVKWYWRRTPSWERDSLDGRRVPWQMVGRPAWTGRAGKDGDWEGKCEAEHLRWKRLVHSNRIKGRGQGWGIQPQAEATESNKVSAKPLGWGWGFCQHGNQLIMWEAFKVPSGQDLGSSQVGGRTREVPPDGAGE